MFNFDFVYWGCCLLKCIKCKATIPDGSLFCNYCGKKQTAGGADIGAIKVPEPIQVSSGNWYIRMRLGGESISVTDSSKALCRKKAIEIKSDYIAGRRKKSGSSKTLAMCIDELIDEKSNILSPSTISGYEVIKRNRFKSVMHKPLSSDINWQKVVNQEAATVAPKTVKNAWGLVSEILKKEKINISDIRLPTIPSRDMPWLTPSEIKTFIKYIEGSKYETACLIALHSFRMSEIIGLTWEKSVDIENGRLKFNTSIVRNSEGQLVTKDIGKSDAANRSTPIMIPRLKYLLQTSAVKTGPVVPYSSSTLYKAVKRLSRNAGVTEVSPHGLRRSFASLAYDCGLSERATMEIGGWKDKDIMHKIYIKLASESIKEAETKLIAFYSDAM